MEIIPSIDLKHGRCVRLYQGDYNQETVYSQDPLSVAVEWEQQGAPRLHLVDLDGAARGNPANLKIIAAIVKKLTIPIQLGGGIRSAETADALLKLGIDRVVIGTAAVQDPKMVHMLCQQHGSQRVVIAVDARDGQVAIKGWQETTRVTAIKLADRMSKLGVCRLLYTDISRDGTLTEPNFDANRTLVERTGLAIQASGGIASLKHIRRLMDTGAEGAILGRALYTGDVQLPNAISMASQPC